MGNLVKKYNQFDWTLFKGSNLMLAWFAGCEDFFFFSR